MLFKDVRVGDEFTFGGAKFTKVSSGGDVSRHDWMASHNEVTPLDEAVDDPFREWLADKGFDPATMTDTQVKSMRDMYEAEVTNPAETPPAA